MEEYGSKLGHSITTLMWRMAHECIGKKEVSTLGEAAKDILYYGLCGKMTYEARFKAVRNLFKVIEGGDELYPKFHSAIVAIFDNITMKAMNFYMRQMVDEYTHSVLAKCHQTFPQNNGAEEDGANDLSEDKELKISTESDHPRRNSRMEIVPLHQLWKA